MRKEKLNTNKIVAIFLTLTLIVSNVFAGQTFMSVVAEENASAKWGISNPRMAKDSAMEAGQKVSWDCIYFGNYPQAEVVSVDIYANYTAVEKKYLQNGDLIVDDGVYEKLQTATDWDARGDIEIDGLKYRRVLRGDAAAINNSDALVANDAYYKWEDASTYHYFQYQPIKWRVLKVDGNNALLLSDICLDSRPRSLLDSQSNDADNYWENCDLRYWMNGYATGDDSTYAEYNFMDCAFNSQEQTLIQLTKLKQLTALKSWFVHTGNDTEDRLFLLSEREISASETAEDFGFVFDDQVKDEARICGSSTYAKAMGITYYELGEGNSSCNWWLRSNGNTSTRSMSIDYNGAWFETRAQNVKGVRVALNLNLSDASCWQVAGTICSDGTDASIENTGRVTDNEYQLKRPTVVEDTTLASGQSVTYDCVWYGNYPQAEVVTQKMFDNYTYVTKSELIEEDSLVVSDEIYNTLSNATEWDANGDVIIDGVRYRRVEEAMQKNIRYYQWTEDIRYHYFRWEPIKWRVLKIEDNQVLLLSDKTLDVNCFHEASTEESVLWKQSTLRSWLNGYGTDNNIAGKDYADKGFLDFAFTTEEKGALVPQNTNITYHTTGANSWVGTAAEDENPDLVFVLEKSDITHAVKSRAAYDYGFALRTTLRPDTSNTHGISTYAIAKGATSTTSFMNRNVEQDDFVSGYGAYIGICPVIVLDLESEYWSQAGTVCTDKKIEEIEAITTEATIQIVPTEEDSSEVDTEETTASTSIEVNTEASTADETTEAQLPDIDIFRIEESTVSEIPVQTYCSEGLMPAVHVTHAGKSLIQGVDYLVAYDNNVNVGIATITVTGLGKYQGSKTCTFKIEPYKVSGLSKQLKGDDGKIYKTAYTGKKIKLSTAFRLKYKFNGKIIYLQPKAGSDYSISYKNNKLIGVATITYRFKGNYNGTVKKQFQIVPKTTKLLSAKKSGKTVKLKWKKVTNCTGYEVYRATSKKGVYKKLATIKNKKLCIYYDRKAKKGKKYYYKVVAYKKVKGKTYKSMYSNIKKGSR